MSKVPFIQEVQDAVGAYKVAFAGTFTTVGGDASEAIAVAGALASDIAVVVVKTKGAVPVSIVEAAAAANAINVTLSADPAADHVLAYVVYRIQA